MSNSCHEEPASGKVRAAPGCHEPAPASCHGEPAADSCCDTPPRTDWFLWTCVTLVAGAWLAAVLSPAHDHASAWGIFTAGIYELLGRMWWGIALGVVFVGLLARIPRDLVMAVLGRDRGLNGLLRATLAGVFLDLCSHGILAVGMKLYERGASIGQVMAFLLASPWNSLSLTLILIGLIGLGWTLLFVALSVVVGLITGWLFNALVARGRLPDNPWRSGLGEPQPFSLLFAEFRRDARWSWGGSLTILRDGLSGSRVVIRWALFGLLLAAAIRALVPADEFTTWFGASFAGLWLTLLAATVIEVCSEGATPIAADLMNRAAAPGNSFTFLMAGVATDYTELMSLRDTTHSWRIALCLPLLAVPQVMVLGYILNQF
jgi:uncharacterized membrane protein YraQ (UPF0718 family)